jgi:two-component system nitrogen regulation sensor histidine kinase GlnL
MSSTGKSSLSSASEALARTHPADAAQPSNPSAPVAARFLAAHTEDVLASLGDGLILLDLDAHVAFVSPRAEDLTGVSAAQAVGRRAEQAFAMNPWIGETVQRLRHGEVGRTSDVGELITPFGRRVAVQLIAAPIIDALGAVVGTLLLFRDMTAQRSLDGADRDSRVGDLAAVAAGLAHEIKNPLGGIKGAAQLLAEELGGQGNATRFTSLITREVDRVSALLEQLLELTRPPRLRLSAVNVHRILNEVLTLERAAGDAALTVRLVFDPSLPEVMADEAKLHQVFLNLVKNALEATNRTGTLTVVTRIETDFHVRHAARDRGQFLSIDIEDTGPGIAAEDCQRIFTPFFTTKTSGTGLGLAVSERLVVQHGGTITIESELGRGTRVRVRLPVAAPERRS